MIGYYLSLALRSLRQNVALTALMIAAIGVGIGASMTTLSIFRTMSGDPIPQKSRQLFAPQIDNYGPGATESPGGGALGADRLPRYMSYIDAVALMRAHVAERQAAMYPTSVTVTPPDTEQLPFLVRGRATYTDFFTMFGVPFEYGAPWSAADDTARAPVVVLSRKLNDQLFGGSNSVGRTVTVNSEVYRVTGVIRDWDPTPRFYDLGLIGPSAFVGPEQMFLPFTTAIARELPGGEDWCPKSPGTGKGALLLSECSWIQMWVELPNAATARAYRTFLTNYAAEERHIGRFNWAPRVALRNVRQWLAYNGVVSTDVSVLVLVSFAFLLVCVLNGVGLMLAKFMARSPQVSVRRALGADNRAIFAQCLVEAGTIGLIGVGVGIGLSILGLLVARGLFAGPAAASLTRLDGSDVVIAVALGVGSTLLAGLYPTWRAMGVLSAPRRNKIGAALIALQMAVTLAILCNAVYIVQQHVAKTVRPSGVDETDDFTIVNRWTGTSSDLSSRIKADVAALRAIPSVADAYVSQTQPFNDGEMVSGITLHPDQSRSAKTTAVYFGDEHAMDTLGFQLSAGRNFNASDISDFHGTSDRSATSGILVTQALARQLAPGGEVLGRVATMGPISAPIVGIIDTLQAPDINAPGGDAVVKNSIVLPHRFIYVGGFYVVRAKPGRLAQAMKAAPAALAHISRQRVIVRVQSLIEARREAYRGDRTVAAMLTVVCLILLAVTAFGIVGLTSYWVSQRRRQIGIRRALGATRGAIMRYFHTENLVIAAAGIVVGVALTVAANLWIVNRFAMGRLPYQYLLIGVVALLVLGQLAVLWPALRAASVPPAVATRNV